MTNLLPLVSELLGAKVEKNTILELFCTFKVKYDPLRNLRIVHVINYFVTFLPVYGGI